jgi:hypothetical protein
MMCEDWGVLVGFVRTVYEWDCVRTGAVRELDCISWIKQHFPC